MRNVFIFIFSCLIQCCALQAGEQSHFRLEKDVAQYKGSDYANVVYVARHLSLDDAFKIAESNPEIDYFMYTKGEQMVLEIPPGVEFDPRNDPFKLVSHVNFMYDSREVSSGNCRVFSHGDVVFFKKEGLWLGTAPGLADTYFKE